MGVVATDVAFTHGYFWLMTLRSRGRTKLRIKAPPYHHGLAPLVSVEDEPWGAATYPYRTNSLGFRDRTPRHVSLRRRRFSLA